MTLYTYSGPLSGATLPRCPQGDDRREVMLHPGCAVELDPEHPYTRTLIARRHLTEVPLAAVPVKKPATKTASDKVAGEKETA